MSGGEPFYWLTFEEGASAKLNMSYCNLVGVPEKRHIVVSGDSVNIEGLILIPKERGITLADYIGSRFPGFANNNPAIMRRLRARAVTVRGGE